MSLRITAETRVGLREQIRQWIIESRLKQNGENTAPSTVEFSLLEAISKELISAERFEALNAISWYLNISIAPEGGLGYRETEDTLTLLSLLNNVQKTQDGEGLSGEEVFFLIQEVIAELHTSMPVRRVDPPSRERVFDQRGKVLEEHPPYIRDIKRQ